MQIRKMHFHIKDKTKQSEVDKQCHETFLWKIVENIGPLSLQTIGEANSSVQYYNLEEKIDLFFASAEKKVKLGKSSLHRIFPPTEFYNIIKNQVASLQKYQFSSSGWVAVEFSWSPIRKCVVPKNLRFFLPELFKTLWTIRKHLHNYTYQGRPGVVQLWKYTKNNELGLFESCFTFCK